MKESLEKKLMEQYPAYHEKPLSLSIAEIDDPRSVLSYFFTCYDLPDLRACLKEFLHDAVKSDSIDASSHIILQQDLEKLVEASWLIYKQNEAPAETKIAVPDIPKKSHLESSTTEESDSKYQQVHEFFESFTLPFARYYLLTAIKAAENPTIWDKSAPTDLLHFFEMLDALVSSTYIIAKKKLKIKTAILPKATGSPDLTQYHLYCSGYDQHSHWDYVPRCLSEKEYCDPYKALRKFTVWDFKQEWQKTLRYILSYALGESSLSELGINLELVKTTELLQKMLEACHLIYVRTQLGNPHSETKN
ncbi:MAG: hypothetical protein IM584_05045 [Chitinophagaceae bacterium]|nr:hypothetical protein [Chitinophagaceae bacterium]MCA6455483.1 hypothetical protein [Chitinophagaceae bacterium]MCA6460570.1 hypothetical protein [Chitinophagaceae bacterium]MCA6464084.1 hypothetical protein [Chitinophagaceae bacterium]